MNLAMGSIGFTGFFFSGLGAQMENLSHSAVQSWTKGRKSGQHGFRRRGICNKNPISPECQVLPQLNHHVWSPMLGETRKASLGIRKSLSRAPGSLGFSVFSLSWLSEESPESDGQTQVAVSTESDLGHHAKRPLLRHRCDTKRSLLEAIESQC